MEQICYSCFSDSLNEAGVCTRCGYDGAKNREKFPQALPQGSILYGRYIVGRVLGQGGFGITYLAQDYQTKELVAIKEFFPDTMATRTGGNTVTPFTGERGENFTYGRDTFLEEAKTMAEFLDNPNIVRVHSYFEENGTGYFVMEYLDGVSFQQYIKDHGGRISWEEALKIMLPILDALSAIHAKGIIHRDVTPDNIFITKDGTVKLLDFGAARYSLGNVSRSLDVILKHGFAPKEQYKRHGRQGPYTDVYSTAATIYYAITGAKPDDAIERSDEDTMPLPTTLGARITMAQESALLKGLAVQSENRYQTMDAFHDALTGAVQPDDDEVLGWREKIVKLLGHLPKLSRIGYMQKYLKWAIGGGAAILVFLAAIIWGSTRPSLQSSQAQSAETSLSESEGNSSDQTELVLESDQLALAETQPEVYTMMAVGEDLSDLSYDDRENTPFWGQIKYPRCDVKSVRFYNSLENAPRNAWDVSEAEDGTILAWMDEGQLSVAAAGVIALNPDSSRMFSYFTNVENISFGQTVDTSSVTNMAEMFQECRILSELDVSLFDTSHVTDMGKMFWACRSLTVLDTSAFNTSQVTDMGYMFYGCNSLVSIDVSGFNTASVTNMNNMFGSCDELVAVDVSGFDTSNVTDMGSMFWACRNLKSVDLSGFDTSQVVKMGRMFWACESLTSLDLSGFDTSHVTDLQKMFEDCCSLTRLDISGFTTSDDTDIRNIFHNCRSLTFLNCTDSDLLSEYRNS